MRVYDGLPSDTGIFYNASLSIYGHVKVPGTSTTSPASTSNSPVTTSTSSSTSSSSSSTTGSQNGAVRLKEPFLAVVVALCVCSSLLVFHFSSSHFFSFIFLLFLSSFSFLFLFILDYASGLVGMYCCIRSEDDWNIEFTTSSSSYPSFTLFSTCTRYFGHCARHGMM